MIAAKSTTEGSFNSQPGQLGWLFFFTGLK
jgi:hypothetical protein